MVKEAKKKSVPKKSASDKQVSNKNQDNVLGILSHLLGLFTGFLGPLVILLASEDKKGKKHSKIALNWQFSALIYSIVGTILSLFFVSFFILLAVGILNIAFCIIAAIKASEGEFWKYPISIPFFDVKLKKK